MAGAIATQDGGRGRKPLDSDINMIPMIDLLMVTIAFLLVTAVWSQMSRLDGTAKVPGQVDDVPRPTATAPFLHVDLRSRDHFVLSWRQGETVTRSVDVSPQFDALREAVAREYRTSGVHTSPADTERDVAVLHTSDDLPFSDMVAAMDAIAAAKRPTLRGEAPAFALTLSTR
jgi:biopolymer transport protein ExbD